ncbi:S1C family serine protease [Alicyclobacillus dauci]|uniref:Trypsin-like peptidase domain-containing protein n=1 Tax=Alicyclobacillus dauci TaxID=1475485 RepID=A0ABY6Z382_9BACL|nr:trypsin-like peptidase domain-containing protein [Alicyclobacillus dauci]WAH36978.1 trypsin-like peptidase domain-containing protein [Alicyclobacillus dauci]
MGFYKGRKERHAGPSNSVKWVAVVVLSALVGSGATIAAESGLTQHGSLPAVAASTGGTTNPGDVSNVSVNVSDGVTKAVQRVEPAVVGIENYTQVSNYFSQQSKLEPTGVGTGVMFYKDNKNAYLVTNNHVVEGAAKVDIVLKSGKHVDATVVGTDPFTDLAVVKVPVNSFKGVDPITFANSDNIQPGEPAIAIGTPMGLDFADTVTSGIVSAKSRVMPVQDEQSQQTLDYQTVIQTDAAINPGNSGGPLVNINGDVIGINSSKIVAPNFEGMGFAIPANEVQTVAKQLMTTGHAQHPALGIQAYSLSSLPQQMWPNVPVDYGVWIKAVTSNETKQGGLQANDVIVGLNGKTIKTIADLRTYLFQTKPGDTVTLKIYRGQKAMTLKVKVGSMDTQLTTAQPQNQSNSGGSGDPLNPFGGGLFQ